MKKLRFAPIVRVSTEKQAKKGESLETQKKQILSAVQQLNGKILASCWKKYCGQEHATPEQERAKFEALLEDASKGLFDAVIVCDVSRWSRDNQKSKEGLAILRENGIRFFVLQSEFDLHDPQATFFIGMATEVNEFQARTQTDKSLLNRIERAKKGWPAVGNLPFGRTFDKDTKNWGVDEDCKKKVETAARLYLAGESMKKIAQLLDLDHSSLHKTLTKRAGDTWMQRFKKRDGSYEEITTKVPRLLSQKVIDKIHERVKANRTYLHGNIKHPYLLARMIFCKECGYAMFGQTNSRGKRYYRHARHRKNPCSCDGAYISADMVESALMVHLFAMFYDPVGLKKAVSNAMPDKVKIRQFYKELKQHRKELEQIGRARERLLDMVEKGGITVDLLKGRMAKHHERESLIREEVAFLEAELAEQPSKDEIQRAGKEIRKLFTKSDEMSRRVEESYLKSVNRLYDMNYKERRQFMQYFFGGSDNAGKRFGVYVMNRKRGIWNFEARGVLGQAEGLLPLKPDVARSLLSIEDDNINPFTGEVCNMSSQCHAHNCLGFYQ